DADHLWRTWHPRTRPAVVEAGDVRWTELSVLEVTGGGVDDDSGVVEFEARFTGAGGADALRERSTFERRGGRWVYVAASVDVGASGWRVTGTGPRVGGLARRVAPAASVDVGASG